MLSIKRAIIALPVACALLGLVLPPAAAQRPATGPLRPAAEAPTPFCPNNRFTNGDFSALEPGRTADPAPPATPNDQDINAATGWRAIWKGTSLADLYAAGNAGPGLTPPPASGNYASMWISNVNSGGSTYREGMFNELVTPIGANTGVYSFTFKTAPLMGAQVAGVPSVIGIYGVRYPNAAFPTTADRPTLDPTNGLNVPTNLNLFGAGNVVLLGTVQIPSTPTAANNWAPQSITFDSAAFDSLPQITHVMVTKMDGATNQARYIAFDDFCMQTAADAGLPTGTTPPPGTDDATCCPPSKTYPVGTLFTSIQNNVGSAYHLSFAMNSTFDSQMAAYVALVKSLNTNFNGIAITIRAFNAGTGTAPVIPAGAQPLQPETILYWHAGAASVAYWPSSTFFTTGADLPVNTWIVVEVTTWTLGPGRFWAQSCEVRRFGFRPQLREI